MVDIKITQPDAVDLKIECDRSLAKELNSYFTFTVPNFQYTPAFKIEFGMVKYDYLICTPRLYLLA